MLLRTTFKLSILLQCMLSVSDTGLAQDSAVGAIPTDLEDHKAEIKLRGADALTLAEKLFEDGELDKAMAILQKLVRARAENVDTVQIAFLTGMIASTRGDHEDAVEIFRKILDVDPSLVRVRLELARSLFELKEDGASAYHFRLALTQDLGENAKKNIRSFLTQIEQRRKLFFNFSASVLPNTNINSGLQGDGTLVEGLNLCGDNRTEGVIVDEREVCAQSGVGLSSSLSATYLPTIAKNLKGQLSVSTRVNDYSQSQFDDASGRIEVGIRHFSKRLTTQAVLTASKRTFGGESFSESLGSRLVLTTPLSSRTRFSINFNASKFEYETNPDRDGPFYSTGVGLTHFLDQRTFVSGYVQLSTEQAEEDRFDTEAVQVSTTLGREFPFGVNVRVKPQVYIRQFKDVTLTDGTFVAGREDKTYSMSLTLTKRDWRWRGFAPAFTYLYQDNQSSERRFEFDRHLIDFEVTRDF